MPLSPGTRLGPYEIVSPLGAGGMGEVYRAKDTKLDRDVAIKVLPESFALDADRVARFAREAKTLAALNHHNIAAVYGIEASAIVMELVDGEDLTEVIARQAGSHDPAYVRETALPIARQIADALEAAHELGIIHRDLKPANIKVRADGTVKVLDFGLARTMDGGPGTVDQNHSPTMTARMTQMGMVIGTAAYMSPEQARGRAVDRRADMWAFGVVLYEMLTGLRAFEGEDISVTLANVIKEDVTWSALPKDLPAPLLKLLRRCLVKDPKQRLADASTARFEIDEALRVPATSVEGTASHAMSRRERMAWAFAAVLAIVAAVAILAPALTRPPAIAASPLETRFTIAEADGSGEPSPDGRSIAYISSAGGRSQIWIHSLATGVAVPVTGIDGGVDARVGAPFWAPDSGSLAFFAGQKLKRITLATGAVQTLADAPTPRGGAWGPDGTILYAPSGNGPIVRVASTGGIATPLTVVHEPQASHRNPVFLPDGRHFLLTATGTPEVRGAYVGSLDAPDITRLFDVDGPVAFAGPDRILFIREGVLYAQRIDLSSRRMTGDPTVLASGVSTSLTQARRVAASLSGVIAFSPDVDIHQEVQWVDRSGNLLQKVGEPLANVATAGLSPDGRTIALASSTLGRLEIWLMEVARGTVTRFASDATSPVFSPDNTRIAFSSGADGMLRVAWQRVDRSSPPEVLLKTTESQNAADWSPDGRYILFATQSSSTARDVLAVPLEGDRAKSTVTIAHTAAEERNAKVSPDGNWVAYQSDETGSNELFVRRFPGPSRTWRVSGSQGSTPMQPKWRNDSKELYYAAGGRAMAARLTATSSGIDIGAPEALFPLTGFLIASPDGKRFLTIANLPGEPTAVNRRGVAAAPVTVVVNWPGLMRH